MDNECQMCFRKEATVKAYHGHDDPIDVCPECKQKWEIREVYNKIQPGIEAICRELNYTGSTENVVEAFRQALDREHRTLQSEFFTMLWKFFKIHGELPENRCDARNAWTVKIAKKWYESL